MLNLIIFGPPGAGKGTQSDFIAAKYLLKHLSTGDLLRSEIGAGTDLGLKAKAVMDRGELVSDEIVIGMIESQLETNREFDGFIFDGFPRTTTQAEALDNLMEQYGQTVACVLSMIVEEEELVSRLLERGKSSGRSDDQGREVIQNRIREYHNKTAPVADYYNKQQKLKEVDGLGGIRAITQRLFEAIESN